MTSAQVRGKLVEALQLDLVGPGPGLGNPAEIRERSGWSLRLLAGQRVAQRTD